MYRNKEIEMKRIFQLSLCAVLVCGLVISSLSAYQERETPEAVQEDHSSEIKELTIRNSGFRSRSTIIIRYRDEDKKIVEVIENGKKLPPEEFGRYEAVIREVLELPQIDRLLPEIERTRRRIESARVSEESKIREILELRKKLEELDSENARRYRDLYEFQLMNQLNNLSEKISESDEMSQEEKIRQLKEVLAKIEAMKFERVNEERRRRLAEIESANVARRLIAEITKSEEMSREEKIKEIHELLQQSLAKEIKMKVGRQRDLVEFEAANAMREMLQEIAKKKSLSEEEKEEEFKRVFEEAQRMQSESVNRMIGIEKFKFDLHRFLKEEGLLPEGEAEFVLRLNECTIDGKKLPKEIHRKILQLCEKDLGKKFTGKTKVILSLNEDR